MLYRQKINEYNKIIFLKSYICFEYSHKKIKNNFLKFVDAEIDEIKIRSFKTPANIKIVDIDKY